MDQRTVIELHGDLEGRYLVEEERPDGAIVIRRETHPDDETVDAIVGRYQEQRLTGDAIPEVLRQLDADGEG
ncbi:MAG: hypothetical protein Q8O56_03535 [Solirubrobacteraceae bacterium]|nr:hypothetical protein [Solirubrobacteraceae bacterium]